MNASIFGNRIRQAREKAGLSQGELAEQVGKDKRAIYEYEKGERKLAATELPLFAKALNVPLLYFFEGELAVKDHDVEFLTRFHQIPLEARQYALDILSALSEAIRITSR